MQCYQRLLMHGVHKIFWKVTVRHNQQLKTR